MNSTPAKRVHLVLGSGGIKTLAYVGAIQELTRAGYSFASVSGCSAGSFIGALVCSEVPPGELGERILSLDLKSFAPKSRLGGLFAAASWPYAVYRGSGFAALLRALISSDPTLEKLAIPFATLGVDLISNSFVVYSKETHPGMHLVEAVSIASGFPFGFAPREEGGRIVVDAAIATTCPVWLTALQREKLPILSLSCWSERKVERPRSFPQYLIRVIEAGVAAGDDVLSSALGNVRRIKILCPKVQSLDFKISKEQKRALLDAGANAIRDARLGDGEGAFAIGGLSGGFDRKHADGGTVETVINHYYASVYMGHHINVGGNAILNIDSVLKNVNQTLGCAEALPAERRAELQHLVGAFQAELEAIKQSHSAEVEVIAKRLQEVVAGVSQPAEKQNRKLLELSKKGLIEAAETVVHLAPKLVATAKMIAGFVVGA